MDYEAAKQRFKAANALLSETSTTTAKARAALDLLKGIHPAVEKELKKCDESLAALEKLEGGAYIELSAEALPETTEGEKKRKRLLVLFIRGWSDLKKEVARVEQEFENAKNNQGSGNASMWAKILKPAAGPLAIITLVAIGIAVLDTTAVTVLIHNDGCGTLEASSSIGISLPGLSLPQAIENGEAAPATLPPLEVSIDGTTPGKLAMSALGMDLSFDIPGVDDVTLDGTSLIGTKTEVKLSEKDTHDLRLICN